MAETRVCSTCGICKPLTNEFFQHRSSGRIDWNCRDCRKAYMAGYYERNRERMLSRVRAVRAADPEFHRARDRSYFVKNREAKRATKKRQWAECDRAAHYARIREWKAANPEKARAIEERRNERIRNDPALRAKAAERMRKWIKSNPEAAAAQRDRRRAAEAGAEGGYSQDDVKALLRLQDRKCYYCACDLKLFTVDHFIALSRGGTNYPANLVIACESCNYSKGAKLPWEWRPERFSEGSTPR